MAEAPPFSIREIELFERPVVLRLPFRFGVVTLTQCPQAFVRARIELADGRSGWGAAAEMMAPKWFDKNLALSNEDNFDQLREVLRLAHSAYLADAAPASAFGHFARHYDAHLQAAGERGFNPLLANYGPALLDRALLDALCRLRGESFYAALHTNAVGIGHGGEARPEFAGLDFDRFLAALQPAAIIEARHTVGMVDAITAADLVVPVSDGLPETLEQVVQRYGHRYFKLKVGGQLQADVERLTAIAAVLDRSPQPYFASLDGNEQYQDAAGVAELLARLRTTPALARLNQSILFVEQPISRLHAMDVDLRTADLGLPVIIDESDGELDTFVQARQRGYAGVSSKTCKGIYKSVLNAARCANWNAQAGREVCFMSAEDLTTQAGLSVQQDLALVNLLGIRHVERNGHHYVNGMAAQGEAEQQAFLAAHPDLYERSQGAVRLAIHDGRIALGSLAGPGFASGAMPDFGAMAAID
jgi:L-alanine-DL-glutamate epimerase-like enolase superfamily enzyme